MSSIMIFVLLFSEFHRFLCEMFIFSLLYQIHADILIFMRVAIYWLEQLINYMFISFNSWMEFLSEIAYTVIKHQHTIKVSFHRKLFIRLSHTLSKIDVLVILTKLLIINISIIHNKSQQAKFKINFNIINILFLR